MAELPKSPKDDFSRAYSFIVLLFYCFIVLQNKTISSYNLTLISSHESNNHTQDIDVSRFHNNWFH